jgi:autotransporter-associated beta strand protein
MKTLFFVTLILLELLGSVAYAGSGTWLLNPINNDWNTAANWSSNTVPNSFNDTASFAVSQATSVSLSSSVAVSGISFTAGADAFTVSALPGTNMQFLGDGIANLSGVEQNFVSPVSGGSSGNYVFSPLDFNQTTITGLVTFTQEARNAPEGDTGFVQFSGGAIAGDATFHNLGATVAGGVGGRTDFFYSNTSADQATIINEGATAAGAIGGASSFLISSPSAGNATLIANAGSNGGGGGTFTFKDDSRGGTARAELFGNGYLDLGAENNLTFSIGSIEGDGQVYLGRVNCSVGSNGLNTTFSGVLHPGAPGGIGNGTGALTKIGSGTLTLTGANLYTAGTTVTAGTLVVSNTTGSGTGTGSVAVNTGTLGGSGIISGAVTVGTGSGSGAFLAPAYGGKKQLTLTIQSSLTFNADSTYTYTFKAKRNKSKTDKVVANGVTINNGAIFNLSGTAQGTLTQGTVLTVIKNTAANSIAGTFSNLSDGVIVAVNGNKLQADYQGGDGNDLTLTVVP